MLDDVAKTHQLKSVSLDFKDKKYVVNGERFDKRCENFGLYMVISPGESLYGSMSILQHIMFEST